MGKKEGKMFFFFLNICIHEMRYQTHRNAMSVGRLDAQIKRTLHISLQRQHNGHPKHNQHKITAFH